MKMKDFGFYRGVNLGGWFSQCDYSEERMDHFITPKDFRIIADWGLDHVRIPVDYNVMETEDGQWKADGFRRIEKALHCAEENGLKVVLDLHKTAGFSFDAGEKEEGFFVSEACQQRFYRLWEEMARRFTDPRNVAFELLNEVTDESFISAWNRIAGECIRRIRGIAPDSLILVGSYHNNAPDALKDLETPADARVIYNFHCYDPLPFTHQGAYWVPWLDPNARVPFDEAGVDAEYFERQFASAFEAAERNHTALYCGEYGVIDIASPEDMLKWYRVIHDTFEKHEVARSAWSYRQMDFGLIDERLDSVRERLIPLL
jgi:aryl-phospho-beta-D-glucosidase BglC (GH1 family)